MNNQGIALPGLGAGLVQTLMGSAVPRSLGPGDGILSLPVRDWWWPLFRNLGFEYHHFWSSVLHWRRLQEEGLIEKKPLEPRSDDESLVLLFCLVLEAENQGHICLPGDNLFTFWQKHLQALEQDTEQTLSVHQGYSVLITPLPLLADRPDSAFVCLEIAGKYWFYTRQSLELETALCKKLAGLIAGGAGFTETPQDERHAHKDWFQKLDASQKKALTLARGQRFFILSGGPGTGKTTLAKRIIEDFIRDFHGKHSRYPEIRLCAPTGRAASRMGEAFVDKPGLLEDDCRERLLALGKTSTTVHRLIQELSWLSAPDMTGPDMILIDETSMLDLRLMAKLLDLLPGHTSLVLLGDHRQIPSVDSGAILGDLLHSSGTLDAGAGQARFAWASFLDQNHRQNPAIKAASTLVQQGIPILGNEEIVTPWSGETLNRPGVFLAPWEDWQKVWLAELIGILEPKRPKDRPFPDWVQVGRKLRSMAPDKVLELFSSLAMLSPLRKGPSGTEKINRTLSKNLGFAPGTVFTPGLPVMILRNDPELQVFNGDRGIIARSEGGYPVFMSRAGCGLDSSLPSMAAIVEWETSFAMTCHKSQGSEFGTVLLLVPPGSGSLMSRELLYTGMTRTKNRLVIVTEADHKAWNAAMENETTRWSRIRDILAGQLTS